MERLVGEGGMGAVFRAYDSKLSRRVAIKVLHGELASRAEFRDRFVAEATLCGRLRHPHLVNVYDFGETPEGGLFIAMEWVHGKDLGYLLRRLGPASPAQVAAMVRQCGEALDCTHRSGVIHRDVKPSNIMLLHSDVVDVRLADFGVARRLTPGVSRTLPGLVVGTPKYLAPEQAFGGRLGPGTDLYALATVIFEMLVGPHANRRGRGSVDLSQAPISMSHPLFSEASPRFGELLEAAWKADLKDRPPQVLDWSVALAEEIEKIDSPDGGWNLLDEAS
jgi:serine/threonine-protein kinase